MGRNPIPGMRMCAASVLALFLLVPLGVIALASSAMRRLLHKPRRRSWQYRRSIIASSHAVTPLPAYDTALAAATAESGEAKAFPARAIAIKLIAVFAVASFAYAVPYTAANFAATTKNPNNRFSSGTLVLGNTKGAGSLCLSTAGGNTNTNVNNNCDVLFNTTTAKPGDVSTADITLQNRGTVNASALRVYTSACTTTNATGETFNGTGNMCAGVRLYIQQYSDATFTTRTACSYGGGTATSCDFSDATKTIANFAATFTSSTAVGLGSLNASASKFYRIGVSLPSNAGNDLQGRQANFDLTWVLEQ